MTDKSPERIAVAAGIIWRNGRFLACQRPMGKPFAGFWEFPGGKVEANETPERALRRELWEELGIRVDETKFFKNSTHEYKERNLFVELYFFQIRQFSGEVISREKQIFKWVTPAEALSLDFLSADHDILLGLAARG